MVALLTAPNLYRSAYKAIFPSETPDSNSFWPLIHGLARHGIYLLEDDDVAVNHSVLAQTAPFRKVRPPCMEHVAGPPWSIYVCITRFLLTRSLGEPLGPAGWVDDSVCFFHRECGEGCQGYQVSTNTYFFQILSGPFEAHELLMFFFGRNQ